MNFATGGGGSTQNLHSSGYQRSVKKFGGLSTSTTSLLPP